MRYFAIFLIFSSYLAAQPMTGRILRATSKEAWIREGNEEKTAWTLTPEAKPDVYSFFKQPNPTWVTLYTDLDSIRIRLTPGSRVDFVVLLNRTDSCFTRFESPGLQNYSGTEPPVHDTIPFHLTDFNNLKIKVILDEKDTIYLKFDSGSTDFRLTKEAIKRLGIQNMAGHRFQIGHEVFENQSILPVELSGQGTAGRFGWNLFDGKIIEIDYDHNRFIIHSRMPKIGLGYTKLEMEYVQGLFCIWAGLEVAGKRFPNRFLFDSGYQRTIMLDRDLMAEQHFPRDKMPVIRKVSMLNGQGDSIPVLTVNNDKLRLGNYELKNIPVQLLSGGNPAGFKAHILGNEVLKRFNTLLDFQKNVVYLKPNLQYSNTYSEASSEQ